VNTRPRSFSIFIQDLPHRRQRYDTCGDWFVGEKAYGEDVWIKVSTLPDRREMWLIAIHELIEACLCEVAGITQAQVDDFDMRAGQDNRLDNLEPGDNAQAPYYRQHQIASGIERLLAAELGVDWLTYERHIEELSSGSSIDPPPSEPLLDDDIPF
jgi:hypothetical protein